MSSNVDLGSERLLLQPLAPSDLETLHALWSAPLVRKFLWDDIIIPVEAAQEVISASQQLFEQEGFGFWNILSAKGKEHLGFCGLRFITETPDIEILYGLWPENWGKGYATEAATMVLRFGFEERKLERILAGADSPNVASLRVVERLGMKFFEQTRSNNLEVIYYALTRDQWFRQQEKKAATVRQN